MKYAIWCSGLSYCVESFLSEEGGNGRLRTLVFYDEEEAEAYARTMQRTTVDEVYFVTPYPPNQNEWRAEWEAARDRVRTLRC